ncbi:MAG: trimeric intracellular cation channel family protein [Chitinophagaceae bacterium]|jgi:uncharacterized membrane protein YeiH|nr:trimeric intracellular cation channel family protein [Chitinophagaceae bacterium]OQY94763.1 MAG: hypothetical protein B6D37_07870 [Sphingobacteriales bacterium UTBCD1]
MNLNFLQLIDILGTFAFAISGAFSAMEKKLDPFGVLVMAFVTAIGGGTLRDMLIGDLPVSWLRNETATIVIFVSSVSAMFFAGFLKRLPITLFVFDALGLGLFTIYGIEKGIQLHFTAGICIALGTITACFGGVIRDVLLNNVPLLFRKEIYALACVVGGLIYYAFKGLNFDPDISKILCILIIVAIRIIAVKFRLSLPLFYIQNKKS